MLLVLVAILLLTMIFAPGVFLTILAGLVLVACVVYVVMELISRK